MKGIYFPNVLDATAGHQQSVVHPMVGDQPSARRAAGVPVPWEESIHSDEYTHRHRDAETRALAPPLRMKHTRRHTCVHVSETVLQFFNISSHTFGFSPPCPLLDLLTSLFLKKRHISYLKSKYKPTDMPMWRAYYTGVADLLIHSLEEMTTWVLHNNSLTVWNSFAISKYIIYPLSDLHHFFL